MDVNSEGEEQVLARLYEAAAVLSLEESAVRKDMEGLLEKVKEAQSVLDGAKSVLVLKKEELDRLQINLTSQSLNLLALCKSYSQRNKEKPDDNLAEAHRERTRASRGTHQERG